MIGWPVSLRAEIRIVDNPELGRRRGLLSSNTLTSGQVRTTMLKPSVDLRAPVTQSKPTAEPWPNPELAMEPAMRRLSWSLNILLSPLILSAGADLGAETTNLQASVENNWIDVRSFGAAGDGHRDDTDPVTRAVSEGIKTGRTVYFPQGTYTVSRPIVITAHGLTLRGDGASHSVIKAAAPMDRMLYLRGTEIVVAGLMFDANDKAVYGIHAFHLNEHLSRLEFLYVVRARSHGFLLDHSQCMEIVNSKAQNNGGDGFHITDCNATTVRHCRAMENFQRGFQITSSDLSGGCYLLQCNAEINGMEALLIANMSGTPTIVRDFWCEGNNPTGSGPHQYDAVRIAARSVALNGCRISTRGDAPVRAKFALRLAADTKLGVETFSGAFRPGEPVTGTQSGASGIVDAWQADPLFTDQFPIPAPYTKWLERSRNLLLREVSGSFVDGETVIGGQSGAKATVSDISVVAAQNCSIADVWIAREQGAASVDRVFIESGCKANQIGEVFRMFGPGRVKVERQ